MLNKEEAKKQFSDLIERYHASIGKGDCKDVSEETIRTWLNEMLMIFGWDVKDVSQVLQERVLDTDIRQKLHSISSSHTRPDYILKNGPNIKTFIDAKSLSVDIFSDKDAAFQIRSYGWSAGVSCAFITNFEQFSIYETKNVPDVNDEACKYAMVQLKIEDYLDNFDILYNHLNRNLVCSGHLDQLYKDLNAVGVKPLDELFTERLSHYRLCIAESLLKNSDIFINDEEKLNYYTQVILDRIIFIRVCEAKGIEREKLLYSFCESSKGFWKCFQENCYMDFYNHYDGTLFNRDDLFEHLKIDDNILTEFVYELYYPYPYRFDIIPVEVISTIYEKFLGTHLILKNGEILQKLKSEYIKTNGTVPTPEYIVDAICRQTIKLDTVDTIDNLLDIKILDPCCGSGIFLVSCYKLLSDKFLDIVKTDPEEAIRFKEYFFVASDKLYLTIEGRRIILQKCLFGIDCDASAIEVSKMSLALKMIDGTEPLYWKELGVYGKKILRDISKNIRLGNTLIPDIAGFSVEELIKIKPLRIEEQFNYIVGNPPYVETKFYKADSPKMHLYLNQRYKSFEKKADLAVLFLERALELLCPSGRVGFIIQKRWFKTEYGAAIRNIISKNGYLDTLFDFSTNDLFPSRQTYIAILILSKNQNSNFQYQLIKDDKDTIKNIFENPDKNNCFSKSNFLAINMPEENTTWCFDNYNIGCIALRLKRDIGILKEFPNLHIRDGIQALWKKVYHLKDVSFNGNIATGKNGFNDTVTVEKDILRGVVYNKIFYPFKKISPSAYCIFPYDKKGPTFIPIKNLKQEYPILYNYLKRYEPKIKAKVKCHEGDSWYRFTREHNHLLYETPKIIIPMTAPDTIGTYISDQGLFMDNSNVWFLTIDGATDNLMKALTCIVNSTVFSVLAKQGANPQLNGYYKFNRQFLDPVPVPVKSLYNNDEICNMLADYYNTISDLQELYLDSTENIKNNIAEHLKTKWTELDDICNELYGLSEAETREINLVGRTVSRVALLR